MNRHPALLIAPWMAIRQSKSGRTRHVVLTNEGISFFRQLTAGRAGSEIMATQGQRRDVAGVSAR
jgi:hypothetical protein